MFDRFLKLNKKSKLSVILFGVALISLCIILVNQSYAIFSGTVTDSNEQIIKLGSLEIVLSEPSTGIDLGLSSMSDVEGLLQEEVYTFTVENTGSANAMYKILLIDDETSNNSYTGTLLDKSLIKLGLEINGKEIGPLTLSELKELLNEKELKSGKKDTYKLRLWISEDANIDEISDQQIFLKLKLEADQYFSKINLDNSGANKPELTSNMIPVYYDESSSTWKKADENNADESNKWYDYDNKIWANAVTVTSTNRDAYQKADVGTEISMDDINTMWVWIPRYSYTMLNTCANIENPSESANPSCYQAVYKDEYYDDIVSDLVSTKNASSESEAKKIATAFKNGESYDGVSFAFYADSKNGLTNLTFEKSFIDNNIGEQSFNIAFESGTNSTGTIKCTDNVTGTSSTSETCTDSTNGSLIAGTSTYTHPAFWWDKNDDNIRTEDEELTGIWVGKFEVSSDTTCTAATSSAVGSGCNLQTIRPLIKPNVTSWRGAQIGTFFNNIYNMRESGNQYGFSTTTETHMIKNMEWGAVTYLSHSKYGINKKISLNSVSTFKTGCGPQSSGSTSSGTTCNTYKTVLGQNASTTGNIYGIYDMTGGSFEYLMADAVNSSGVMMSGMQSGAGYNSGFTGSIYNGGSYTAYTGSYSFPNKKYYDKYSFGTSESEYTRGKLGDATKETMVNSISLWYSEYGGFITGVNSWVVRSASYNNQNLAGIFLFSLSTGGSASDTSTRAVISNLK